MADLTEIEQYIAEQTAIVMLMRGALSDGQQLYMYIAVRADHLDAFLIAQEQPGFNPQDYGTVIESGIGEPTPEVMARMEREYGFRHQGMVPLSQSHETNDADTTNA